MGLPPPGLGDAHGVLVRVAGVGRRFWYFWGAWLGGEKFEAKRVCGIEIGCEEKFSASVNWDEVITSSSGVQR